MTNWRVARSLDTLLAEINEAAPNRSKISDGSIGDPAHSSRESDHNPNPAGVVRARDFTHDIAGGLDCRYLAAQLTKLYKAGHPALGSGAYTIWNRHILSRDRFSEGWRPYTGTNPHEHHLHQSVATAASGYDSPARWGVMEEEDDMADYAEQLNRIEGKVDTLDDVLRAKLTRANKRVALLIKQGRATRAELEKLRDDLDADA